MKIFILFIMLFLHIVDDYYLQGVLAQLKQKAWWEMNVSNSMYKNDYIIALIEHAFSWTFMIMLPIIINMLITNNYSNEYLLCFIINCFIHGFVDHLKCNKTTINLLQDQIIHICQVIITWIVIIILK